MTPSTELRVDSSTSGAEPELATEFDPEDDILDAVLAARDSLLTDLAKTPEESGEKKSEPQRKEFAPPKRKPLTDNEALSEAPSSLDALAPHEQVSADQPLTQVKTQVTEPVSASEIEDRPPWEEPVEVTPAVSACSSGGYEQNLDVHQSSSTHVEAQLTAQAPRQEQVQTGIQTQSFEPLPPLGEGEVTGHEIDLKWYRLMSAIDVGGRVRQLAVNSVCHEFTEPLSLLLKPNQKHLAADIAIVQLEEALAKALGGESKVNISVGVDGERETPLEVRQRFHREIQAQAHQGLLTDSNIQWLMSQMGAELEDDSLSYAPELLSLKGNTIELIDKSNFKALPQS